MTEASELRQLCAKTRVDLDEIVKEVQASRSQIEVETFKVLALAKLAEAVTFLVETQLPSKSPPDKKDKKPTSIGNSILAKRSQATER